MFESRMNIFRRKRKVEKAYEIRDEYLYIKYYEQEYFIEFEKVNVIEISYDFTAGFVWNVIFCTENEVVIDGSILNDNDALEVFRKAFPSFLNFVDLSRVLDLATMWGWEIIWVRGEDIVLPKKT